MELPKNKQLPFFAYGIFKPGQLAFFQLREFIAGAPMPARVKGAPLLRDGLLIADPNGSGHVDGMLLEFRPEQAEKAYQRIADMEPGKHYRWEETKICGNSANILWGRVPSKGSYPCETDKWNGWDDPLFTAALEVVEETLRSQKNFNWDMKPFFRLQMAYLLLWSSIERYVTLRYCLGASIMEKVNRLTDEPAFAEELKKHVKQKREIFRADRPDDKCILDSASPKKSLDYYYQIRSNITHQGKGAFRDFDKVRDSLRELLPIFRDVLSAAKREAECEALDRAA